jgi:hypothetical protein
MVVSSNGQSGGEGNDFNSGEREDDSMPIKTKGDLGGKYMLVPVGRDSEQTFKGSVAPAALTPTIFVLCPSCRCCH